MNCNRRFIGRAGHTALATTALALCAWPFVSRAQFSLTTSSYSQNFDALGSAGTTTTTIPGWFTGSGVGNIAAVVGTTVTVGTGASTAGNNYNFGVAGTNPLTDRALGSLASAGNQKDTEFHFTNDTGNSIISLTLAYTGEEWRVGGTAAVNNVLQLQFSFDGTAGSFSPVGSTFDFNTPIDSGTAGALDGNAAANRVTGLGGIFTLPSALTAGSAFYLRWADPDDASSDNAVAIDDFSLTATFAAVPMYWDLDGVTPGIGGASGTWDTTTSNWSTDPTGSIAPTTFTSSSLAVFGGTAGSVTIAAGGVSANGGVQFDSDAYTVGGGTLTLGGTASVAVTNAGQNTTINSTIAGASGLNKTGAGTLTLGAASNTFTGNVTVSGGTLAFSSDAQLGNAANGIVLASGTLAPTASVTLGAGRSLTGTGSVAILAGQTLTVPGAVNAALTLSGNGTLSFIGASKALTALNFSSAGTLQSNSTIALNGDIASTNASGTATVASALDLGAAIRKVTVADGTDNVDMVINGNLTNTIASRLLKLGDGTLRIVGDNTGLVGGVRMGTAGTVPASGGRLLISDKNALGTGGSLQMQYNDGILENESATPLTGANAIPIGLSIGAGQINGATFAGNDMEFTGASSLFKPGGAFFQHKITVNTNVIFSGSFGASTSTGGSTGLTIAGTGSLTLANASNAHDVPITVDGPTFVVSGSLSASAATVTVNSGKLKGGGSIAGDVAIGDGVGTADASIEPGNGIGTLTVPGLSLNSDGVYKLELDSGAQTADKIVANGTVTLGDGIATLSITDLGSGTLPIGLDFTIIDNQSTISGTTGFFAGMPNLFQFPVGANMFQIQYGVGTDSNDVILHVVPEPASAALLVTGLAPLLLRRRRRA